MSVRSDLAIYGVHGFSAEIEELIDKACSALSPDDFDRLLDDIDMILADYRR